MAGGREWGVHTLGTVVLAVFVLFCLWAGGTGGRRTRRNLAEQPVFAYVSDQRPPQAPPAHRATASLGPAAPDADGAPTFNITHGALVGSGRNSRLCVTTFLLMGGLGNSMGLYNTALDFAMRNGFTFLFVDISPPRHRLQVEFKDLFGPSAVTRAALEHPASALAGVPVLPVVCSRALDATTSAGVQANYSAAYRERWSPPGSRYIDTSTMMDRCQPELTVVDLHRGAAADHAAFVLNKLPEGGYLRPACLSGELQSLAEGRASAGTPDNKPPARAPSKLKASQLCDAIVTLPGMLRWHFNLTLTGPVFQALYHAHHNSVAELDAARDKVVIAMHIRLGDVALKKASIGLAKHTIVEYYAAVLLGILMPLMRPACMDWHIVTESPDHADIAALKDTVFSATAGALQPVFVRGSARHDFDLLAGANVLVTGGSSFGRFAGMLSRNAVICTEQPERPIPGAAIFPSSLLALLRSHRADPRVATDIPAATRSAVQTLLDTTLPAALRSRCLR